MTEKKDETCTNTPKKSFPSETMERGSIVKFNSISPYKSIHCNQDVGKDKIPKCPGCGMAYWVERKTKKLVCISCNKPPFMVIPYENL